MLLDIETLLQAPRPPAIPALLLHRAMPTPEQYAAAKLTLSENGYEYIIGEDAYVRVR